MLQGKTLRGKGAGAPRCRILAEAAHKTKHRLHLQEGKLGLSRQQEILYHKEKQVGFL